MRKLILNLALSLDGLIEGPKGEYDWCFDDQDYGLTEFVEEIDALLMGRKTYETLQSAGPDPFPSKHKYIVSSKLTQSNSSETIIANDPIGAIHRLKKENGMNIWLFGGAQLTDALLKEKLVDEFQLSIHPLLLGGGTRLFRNFETRIDLELIDCKQYDSGLVQLFYCPKY
ncbi:MAG: dihydrofolate reductase [Candidatus Melainabacteria bacterium]|nr:dihydrofolate reductase [Candidatus Melainabacteria bacterium]